jgi:hypothetical protein
LKKFAAVVLAGFCCIAAFASARAADSVASSTILSPDDVKIYGEIFAAQKSGQFAKADRLVAQLEDKSLLGYVLQDRYLGAHYRSKFDELKSWLEEYADLAGADGIYKLAVKRAPKKASVPAPARAHWRGAAGDGLPFDNMKLQSEAAERVAQQLRSLARDDRPEAAEALLRKLAASHGLQSADLDRLTAYVAIAYLGEMRDQAALSLSQEVIARHGVSAPQCEWTAGLASYRLGRFEDAARHFETVMQSASAPRTYAAAAF